MLFLYLKIGGYVGMLQKLFKSRDKPENKLSNNTHSFFIGQSSSSKRVNEKTAMTMSAVYSCVRILSEILASLPFHVYEITNVGSRKATKYNLYNLLIMNPIVNDEFYF